MEQYRPARFRMLPPVVKNLLIINILLLIATFVLNSRFGINLTEKLGLFYFESEHFRPYQFITHIFMHGSISHLFFNMFALWMFGTVLEGVWGGKRFLFYYMVTGLGAAALHTFVNWWQISSVVEAAAAYSNTPSPETFEIFVKDYFPGYYKQVYDKLLVAWISAPKESFYIEQSLIFIKDLIAFKMDIPTVGASGAVFGVLLAFGMLFPNSLLYIYFAIPIKAKYFVILYGILELYLGVMNQPGDNVAHFAHLGGMLFGFLLIKYWKNKRTKFY